MDIEAFRQMVTKKPDGLGVMVLGTIWSRQGKFGRGGRALEHGREARSRGCRFAFCAGLGLPGLKRNNEAKAMLNA